MIALDEGVGRIGGPGLGFARHQCSNFVYVHLSVLLTFGLALPFIAFVICCSFIMETVSLTILLGRAIEHAKIQHVRQHRFVGRPSGDEDAISAVTRSRSSMSILGSNPSFFAGRSNSGRGTTGSNMETASRGTSLTDLTRSQRMISTDSVGIADVSSLALLGFQSNLRGTWSGMFTPLCLIIFGAIAAWCAYGFDMIGDVYGISTGTETFALCIVLLPFVVWLLFGLTNLCFDLSYSSSLLSLPRVSPDTNHVTAGDTFGVSSTPALPVVSGISQFRKDMPDLYDHSSTLDIPSPLL
jgi:uncharacterized membrane protein (UPF0136 family)